MIRKFHTIARRVRRGGSFMSPLLTGLLFVLAGTLSQSDAIAQQGDLVVTCPPDKSISCTAPLVFDPPTVTGDYGQSTKTCLGAADPIPICGKTYSVQCTWLVSYGQLEKYCYQTVTVKAKAPDIDSAPDKTVAWGTDWDFDKPKLHVNSCGNDDVDVDIVSTITNALCGRSYQAIRKWEAKDNCGNKDTCKQIVTVIDTAAPVLVAMPNKRVECGDLWTFDTPMAFDARDGSPLAALPIGTVTNVTARAYSATCTWETADGCGQTARCSQSVTVEDWTPPLLIVAADRTVELGTAWTFDPPTAFDNCSGSAVDIEVVGTVTNLYPSMTCSATRSWIAADANGNSAWSSQTVTETDTTPPTLVAPADLRVPAGSAWEFGTPTVSDASGEVTLVVESTTTNRTCGNSLVARRTWQATDPSGNSALGSQTVVVTDDEAPTLTCAAAKTVEAGSAWNFDVPEAFDLGDGGSVPVVILSTSTNDSSGVVALTRIWRAADACGNSAECSQTVTVTDTTPPTLVAPEDLRVPAGTAWEFGTPTVSDAGGEVTLVVDSTTTNRTCGNSFVARRTWQATDLSGNSALGSQTVMVTDDEAPTLTCAAAKTVEAGNAWNFDVPEAFDVGDGGSIPVSILSTSTNDSSGAMALTRVWRAVDACGNSVECSQTVTVADTTPPTLVAPADLRVPVGTAWEFGTPTVSDAGGEVTLVVESTTTNRTCGSSFVARRSWRATDPSGNSALGSQTVVVTDDEAPTLTCAAAKSVEAGSAWNFDVPEAFDLGDGGSVPVIILSTSTNDASGGGVDVTRVWGAADACGNRAECSQTVSIVDAIPPVLVNVPAGGVYRCFGDVPPPPLIEALDSGDGLLIATCSTTTNGVCPTFIVHTWTASDLHGNTATASQTNMVFIDPPRIVSEPADQTLCAGERVELCLELAGVCAASYEWLKDGQPLAGATQACLVFNAVSASDAGTYCVRVSGDFCPEGEPQLIRCATIVVRPELSVAALAPLTRRVGERVTFRATVAGTELQRVWRRNGVVIPGESGDFTIPAVGVADGGVYSVEVIGPCGSVAQETILTVLESPAANSAPYISSIADRVLQHDQSTGEIPFTIGDAETPAGELAVFVTSSEPMLLPPENILLRGGGSARTVMVVAPSAGSGQVTVTLTVSDGRATAGANFKVAIAPNLAARSRLAICIHGDGTVTPDLNGQELIVGETYAVRAVHGAGQMFTGWTGEAPGTEPLLTFVMTPNLMLNVAFEPNPYLRQAGNYNGLFHEADEVRHDTSGFFTLTRNAKGKYTGTVMTGGRRMRFSGQFDALGNGTNLIRRGKAAPFVAELHIGAGDRPDEISGRITGGAGISRLIADRAAFHAVTNRAPFAGRYTLVIPGQPLDETLPSGDGFGALTVGLGGKVTFAGTLADGRKVAQRVPLGRGGEWPLYAALYGGRGSLLSWQTFGNRPTEDVGGRLSWIRPPLTQAAAFTAGFSFDAAATGSRYAKPSAGGRVLDLSEGVVSFGDGGPPMFTNSVTLGTGSKFINHSANVLQLAVNPGNGLFHGFVVNPFTGAKEIFKGALLQKQNCGSGFYTGTNGVGRVGLDTAR